MDSYKIIAKSILLTDEDGNSFELVPTDENIIVTINKSGVIAMVEDIEDKADLVDGVVPISQLPPGFQPEILLGEYVDSITFNDEDENPYTPEVDKLYVDVATNVVYRWTGVAFVNIPNGLALGETSATAYRGDRGKAAYDHISDTNNPHGVTKSQVGLGSVDNTSDLDKPVSTATQVELNKKADTLTTFKVNTGSYELEDGDHETVLIIMDNGGDANVTVPPDEFQVGASIDIVKINDGEVYFVPGAGVTFISADDDTALRTKGSAATLKQIDVNQWLIIGDLKAAI